MLESTLRGLPATDPARVAAADELRKNGVRPLVEILASPSITNTQLLLRAVVLLIATLNGASSPHRLARLAR